MIAKLSATLLAVASLSMGVAHAGEDKITKGYNTMDSMGCMLMRDCKEDVDEVYSLLDVSSHYNNTDEFTPVAHEFNFMLQAMNRVGIKVFLANERYFPIGHRGVYHTVSNNVYLNDRYMGNPATLMSVMRHEGWHAAQDCMAGTIENNMIAIIMPEEEIPVLWKVMAERTYPPHSQPWEAEATWAGKTEGMTMKALQSCANGTMWTDYEPTPLTKEWLQKNNYLPHIEYHYHTPHYNHWHRPQKHNHLHWHPKRDLIHRHEHKHGYGERHHGVGKKHKADKTSKTIIKFHVH